MKVPRKISLVIIATVLVAVVTGFIWFEAGHTPAAESGLNASQSPTFEVRVAVPWMGRPLGGVLPDWVVKKMDATPSELSFDQNSSGANFGSVRIDRLELRAEGWDLLIETDESGRITPETRLVFPLALGGKHMRLNCQPDDRPRGDFRSSPQPASELLSGSFQVELTACKNAE